MTESVAATLPDASPSHLVHFYRDGVFPSAAVASFLLDGLSEGESAIVVATPEHAGAIRNCLPGRGSPFEAVDRGGRLVMLDARGTLDLFMGSCLPNRARFFSIVGSALDRATALSATGRVRAYGEMVGLLAGAGNHAAAIELESLWNDLLEGRPVRLYCAYPVQQFAHGCHAEPYCRVCLLHDHVVPVEVGGDEAADGVWAAAVLRHQEQALRRAISEQKQAESQFRQAQKMEPIGRLAGGIAHDFNNLMTVINGYSLLLLEGEPLTPAQREMVLQIAGAAERATHLTGQLLTFSRHQRSSPRVLSLNDVVTAIEPLLYRLVGEDVQVAVSLAPDLAVCRADPGQMDQVLLNLAVNARDAMPGGGRLTIATANVNVAAEDVGAGRHEGVSPGHYVALEVCDTGCGMDAETRARIFEPFFTTKGPGKGTGLGLSTVAGIVQEAGGTVTVDSEPGLGARFTILLPQAPTAEAAQ